VVEFPGTYNGDDLSIKMILIFGKKRFPREISAISIPILLMRLIEA